MPDLGEQRVLGIQLEQGHRHKRSAPRSGIPYCTGLEWGH